MDRVFQEQRRRNAVKASVSIISLSWVLIEAADIFFPVTGINPDFVRFVIIFLVIGFPLWVVFAHIFKWTPILEFRKL